MFLILIINTAAIITNMVIENEKIIAILDIIDTICLVLYIIEFLLKIVGLGILKYFEDSWNQ